MKLIGTFLLIFSLSSMSNAGMVALTHHSRANCAGFNESVSWDFLIPHEMWVLSEHTHLPTGSYHWLASGWQNIWRNAEYHSGEGYGGWISHGTHWMKDVYGRAYIVAEEFTDNCDL